MPGDRLYRLVSGSQRYSLDDQLSLLADVTQGFASSLDVRATLQTAINRFVDYLDAEAVSIFILENDGHELVCHACAGPVDIHGLRMDAHQGIVGKTVRENACQMVRDVLQDHDFEASVDAGTGFVTRSILCAPLSVNGICIGALELINKRGGDGLFDLRDKHLLTALASAAALAINNARMAEALIDKQRMEKELELAREIQEGLLPRTADTGFPVAGMNVPARQVSGDFFDFFQLPDGRIYFNIGDVSGKGINAALLMAKTSSLLRCLAKTSSQPGALLEQVNDEICETITHGMFVTIVSGFIEPEAGVIRFANAGHQPPLYRRVDGSFIEYPAQVPPLGILPGLSYPEEQLDLDGGQLYLFTDGVTESVMEAGKPLDVDGLIHMIDRLAAASLQERLQHIVAAVQHPGQAQHDDITLMLIECRTDLSETLPPFRQI